MAEGGGGQQIGAVGKGGAEDRGEVTIADGELLGEVVIEGNVSLRVETHGLIVGCGFDAVVVLLGDVIDADEPVAFDVVKRVHGMEEVDLFVGLEPGMIEVGAGAAAIVVEGKDGAAVVVGVGVEAGDVAGFVGFASQAVDAVVIVFATAA